MIALFFDTETTGLPNKANPPALVQLAAILQDLITGRVLGEINLIANLYPGVTIPQEAYDTHGITDDMTRTYGIDPKLIDLTFGKMVKMADVLVAHNLQFDVGIVRTNMPQTRTVIDLPQHFCTKTRNLFAVQAPKKPGTKGYYDGDEPIPKGCPYKMPKLIEAYRHYYNRDFENAHDAMSDTKACRDVFLAMIADGWYTIENIPGEDRQQITATAKYDGERSFYEPIA